MDSGTIGLAAAGALGGRRLTVMPLSVHNARALTGSPLTNVLIPGGAARSSEGPLVTASTVASLHGLRFQTVIFTCCGFSLDSGVSAIEGDGTHHRRRRAGEICALGHESDAAGGGDGRALERRVLQIVRVDVVVTDVDAPEDAVGKLRAAGVTVVQS